jgi:hypothetical protein
MEEGGKYYVTLINNKVKHKEAGSETTRGREWQ